MDEVLIKHERLCLHRGTSLEILIVTFTMLIRIETTSRHETTQGEQKIRPSRTIVKKYSMAYFRLSHLKRKSLQKLKRKKKVNLISNQSKRKISFSAFMAGQ